MFKKTTILILLSLLVLGSCGKKSGLKYPGKQKKPDFDKVIWKD